jgi:hypothetical protein
MANEEVRALQEGELEDSPQDELPALLYAQHWAETRGQPASAARKHVTEQYGEEAVEAIELALRTIQMGNLLGNTVDYVLYRLSFGREKWPFRFGIFACLQFVVVTIVAMGIYPGGTMVEPSNRGYSFFRSFFSELGMTVTSGGRPNLPSAILFIIALTVAGAGLIVFYLATPRFFQQPRLARVLSVVGSILGVVSGGAYIGIAWTPANLFEEAHTHFVLLAFRSFLVVVVCYAVAIFVNKAYPNRYGVVYVLFAALLAGYIWLLTQGPGLETERGIVIQATGQKVIVYAAILCTLIQSWGALRQGDELRECQVRG